MMTGLRIKMEISAVTTTGALRPSVVTLMTTTLRQRKYAACAEAASSPLAILKVSVFVKNSGNLCNNNIIVSGIIFGTIGKKFKHIYLQRQQLFYRNLQRWNSKPR